jgi:hypothetical protein
MIQEVDLSEPPEDEVPTELTEEESTEPTENCKTAPNKKAKFITARVHERTYNKFIEKTQGIGSRTGILREIIEAWIDGRLIIKEPAVHMGKLYQKEI